MRGARQLDPHASSNAKRIRRNSLLKYKDLLRMRSLVPEPWKLVTMVLLHSEK